MMLLLTVLAVIFTLVAAYHVVTPFLASAEDQLRFEALDEDLRRVEELVARRASLLQELRAIRLDYETDKITEEDYEESKNRFERQALGVMRELDELHGGRGWEEAIDDELAARLERLEQEEVHNEVPDEDDGAQADLEEFIACDECGYTLEPEARFCSRCGTPLEDDTHFDDENRVEETAAAASRPVASSGSEVAT